ncbi:MAG: hypothetical protein QM490_05085 [Candidatus Gracilibacteria bacterium]
MKFLKYLLLLILVSSLYIGNAFANINLTVSPIRYEIDTSTGSIITKTATLFNRSDQAHTIITGKSDFVSKDSTGNPHFIRKSELVFSGQELSSWIEIDIDSFVIEPGESKDISFTITIPVDATPGGHYGAIFFKNNNSEESSGAQIAINVDYGVLLLIKVDGEIITKADVQDTIITDNNIGSGWGGGYSELVEDDCLIIDLTKSRYDGKCIDNFFKDENLEYDVNELNLDEISELELEDFNINFETLFINEGNTHLKPSGTIKLVDEDGKEIKGIGKEVVKNDEGAIIGVKIVDYLPINDNGGNVLPGTNRNFESEWKGFPYEGYDENGKKIIKYWSPEEYYTKQNVEERGFLLPWERENERINHEKIKAYIDISYINKDGESVEFNSAQEFYVDYKEKYIGLNPYVFIITGFVTLFLLFLWLICKKKKIKCINCKKKLDKDMKICPYCGTKQVDKRFKKKKKKKNKSS